VSRKARIRDTRYSLRGCDDCIGLDEDLADNRGVGKGSAKDLLDAEWLARARLGK
jgi:hypothetical protein